MDPHGICIGPVSYTTIIAIRDDIKKDKLHFGKSSSFLTHWGPVTHICISKLTITGSDNGLLPGRHQAIIWTNAGILFIGHSGTNFGEILIEIHTFSYRRIHLKVSSEKWRLFCLGLNEWRIDMFTLDSFSLPSSRSSDELTWFLLAQ